MKITSKKCVDSSEEIIYHETYEIRVQITKGNMVTIKCKVEDGEFDDWEGKTEKDKKVIDKLTSAQLNYIDELLSKEDYA